MTRAALVLALAVVTAARAATLATTLVDPAAVDDDLFGSAVATDGARVLVGARFVDAPGAADAGAAYVDGKTLVAATPAVGDQLGSAVAFLGADVLVGAPHVDSGAPHAGAVVLFQGATGSPLRTLTAPAPVFDDLFGTAIAVRGTDVLVGAPGASGVAYLLSSGGTLLHAFTSPDPHPGDLFGAAVAATGNVVAVGAPFDDGAGPNAGAVYLFDAGTGALRTTLTAPRPHAGDFFGSALAAANGTLLVGAPYGGAAHLFDAGTGALLRTFTSDAPDDRFGAAVGVAGAAVVVGAPFDDQDGTDTGLAYVFDANTGSPLDTLHNPTPDVGDQFGGAVAIAGNRIAVAAWLDDTVAPNAGAVYVFDEAALPPIVTTTTVAVPTTTTTTSTSTSSTSSSSTATTVSTAPDATSTTTSTTTVDGATSTSTTTATTTVPPGGVPTTTLAPSVACAADAPVCDDANPCTTDSCSEAGCVHVDATGVDAVTCRLDAIDTVLHEVPVRSLGGAALAASLETRVATARRIIAKRKVRRARRVLRRLQNVLAANLRRGRIVHAVGGNLLSLAADAAARLE